MSSAAKRLHSTSTSTDSVRHRHKRQASDTYINDHVPHPFANESLPTEAANDHDISGHEHDSPAEPGIPNVTFNETVEPSTASEPDVPTNLETVSVFSLPDNDQSALFEPANDNDTMDDNAQQPQPDYAAVMESQRAQMLQMQQQMLQMQQMFETMMQQQQQQQQQQQAPPQQADIPAPPATTTTVRRTTVDQKFGGKRDAYRAWKSLVLMNAEVDNTCWPTRFSKVVWVRGLLEGDAAQMTQAWFDEYTDKRNSGEVNPDFNEWNDLWSVLDKFYVNQFDHSRRIADYRRVKQGSRPHSEYYQEWEAKRVAAGVNSSADSLLADYMNGMNAKLRDHIQGFVDFEQREWHQHIALISRMAEGWESHHKYGSNVRTAMATTATTSAAGSTATAAIVTRTHHLARRQCYGY